MSINHCYSSELSEVHQWRSQYMINMNNNSNHHHHSSLFSKTSISPNFNPNHLNHRRAGAMNNFSNEDDEDRLIDEQRENPPTEQNEMPLFEKPLTPSDVGKLNRLVIPKQHAEKYFPINGGDSGEKGLLLGFEDEIGKSWRFRYSYWNSSQSYVLTKGWSRFVKEKKLDAGDIVLFKRHRIDAARLFIGWRRRSSEKDSGGAPPVTAVASGGVPGAWNRMVYPSHGYASQHQGPCTLPYNPIAGTISHNQTSNGNPKRLRLFGVNLECHVDESPEPSTSDGSPMSSQGQASYHSYYQPNNYLDISFSGGGA